MADNRSSNIDVTQIAKPIILVGSKEDYYLSPDAATRVYNTSGLIAQGGSGGLSTFIAAGDSSGVSSSVSQFDRPQLADIYTISHDTYFDSQQQKVRAKMTITMRNSSGKQILGIDARITVPSSSGGN